MSKSLKKKHNYVYIITEADIAMLKKDLDLLSEDIDWGSIPDAFRDTFKQIPEKAREAAHATLDTISILSSMVPGIGTGVSVVADLTSAVMYYGEEKYVISCLYAIMAIPFVGDVFAIPIQAALKLGGKGIMKIPKIGEAIAWLLSHSSFVRNFLERLVSFAGTGGTTEKIASSSLRQLNKMLAVAEKEGNAGLIKYLEKNIAKELTKGSEKGLIEKAIEKVSDWFAGRLVKAPISYMKRKTVKFAGDVIGSKLGADKKIKNWMDEKEAKNKLNRDLERAEIEKKCSADYLRLGCEGSDVETLQNFLIDLNYGIQDDKIGKFGKGTQKSIKKLQFDNGLRPDGISDYFTLSKIQQLLTVGKTPKFENINIIKNRNLLIEQLVFERLVSECK